MKNELKTLCGLDEITVQESFKLTALQASALVVGVVGFVLTLLA